MKLLTALVTAALATLTTTVAARASDTATPSIDATTCVSLGATWVANQQVTPPITVCVPTP